MNYVEHSAISFKFKNRIGGKVTLKKLSLCCRRNGYIIKSFSESASFLLALGLFSDLQNAKSLSVIDAKGNTLIFLRNGLSANERLFSLAHELGHITLKHRDHSDPIAENEANSFAHYLLSARPRYNILLSAAVLLISCSLAVSLLAVPKPPADNTASSISPSHKKESSEQDYNTLCFFTESGEVYHLYSDCSYIKNSKTVYSDTISNCNKDRMCSRCEQRYKEKE